MPPEPRSIERSDLSGSVDIFCVDPALAARVWLRVKPRFVAVLQDYPSDTTIDATEKDVLAGLQLLWVAVSGVSIIACATTNLSTTPRRKICSIVLAFGEHTKLWDRFIPMVEKYARDEGCSNLRIEGRPGWKRVLRGFSEPWVVLDKELI